MFRLRACSPTSLTLIAIEVNKIKDGATNFQPQGYDLSCVNFLFRSQRMDGESAVGQFA